MTHLKWRDVERIQHTPASPGTMRSALGKLITRSSRCEAQVEVLNDRTGEYRVVLQGKLVAPAGWLQDKQRQPYSRETRRKKDNS